MKMSTPPSPAHPLQVTSRSGRQLDPKSLLPRPGLKSWRLEGTSPHKTASHPLTTTSHPLTTASQRGGHTPPL